MTSALALLTVVFVVGYLAIQVALHRAATGYSWIANAVSDYGVGPTARLFTVGGLINTMAGLALAAALVTSGTYGVTAEPVWLLLLVAVARIGVAVLPTDLPGASTTTTGRLHLLAAIVQFAALYTALANGTRHVLGLSRWTWPTAVGGPLLTLVTIGLVGVCAGLVLRPARRFFGLAERLFLYGSAVLVAAWAVALLTR